jgi:putative NIF3 family GTP cyclohydrolase 1 type 2
VRVSGDLDAPVRRVAVSGGSGDAFLADVRAAGADVYVCADLRHHPVSELREETGGGRPYLVDVAHFASEWPWLPRAAATLEADVAAAGAVLATRVSTVVTDPWTARLDAAGHPAAAPPSPGGNP